jgi:hypothetical protein
VPAAFAFEIGEILARIHALDVQWTRVSIEDPTPRDWPELAERAEATGQPWARPEPCCRDGIDSLRRVARSDSV